MFTLIIVCIRMWESEKVKKFSVFGFRYASFLGLWARMWITLYVGRAYGTLQVWYTLKMNRHILLLITITKIKQNCSLNCREQRVHISLLLIQFYSLSFDNVVLPIKPNIMEHTNARIISKQGYLYVNATHETNMKTICALSLLSSLTLYLWLYERNGME